MKINLVLDIISSDEFGEIEIYNEKQMKRVIEMLLEYGENSLVEYNIIKIEEENEK